MLIVAAQVWVDVGVVGDADDAQAGMGLIQGDEVLLVAVLAEADQQNTVGLSGHGMVPRWYLERRTGSLSGTRDSITALRMIAKRARSG